MRNALVFALIVAGLYVVTLLAIAAIAVVGVVINLVLHWPIGEAGFRVAFQCANVVGGFMSVLCVLQVLLLRVRVYLGKEELSAGLGIQRKAYAYRSMIRCQVERSPKVKSLRCLAFLTLGKDGEEEWHRFEFGERMPLSEVVAFLEGKGVVVEELI